MLTATSDREPDVRAQPSDIAHLIYTSGTTGRPKGVMFQHHAVIAGVRKQTLEGSAADPVTGLIVMPLSHSGGRLQSLSFLLLGGTVVLHRAFDAHAVLQDIEKERCTALHAAPIMIQRILEVPDRMSFDTQSLRCVRYASAPMPVPLLRRALEAFGSVFNQVYGMTECAGITILKAHDHAVGDEGENPKRLASAGQPPLGTQICIVRADGSEAPPGEIGEILIRSEASMFGYWNNDTATFEAMSDGWVHSQDIGVIDEDGFLYILDRKKDMIVSGGENIYSWEIEEALRHHPAVAEVAVIAIPDPKWGESVKACVVFATVRASMKVSSSITAVAELPVTRSRAASTSARRYLVCSTARSTRKRCGNRTGLATTGRCHDPQRTVALQRAAGSLAKWSLQQ